MSDSLVRFYLGPGFAYNPVNARGPHGFTGIGRIEIAIVGRRDSDAHISGT
jgi:hypothetical protein